ncbi:MAG TPA: hypothetical protein VNA23_01250 [Anaerolineales bacterium]|nr:hypothetical protein [Anaerolineales bacterium]
MKPYNKEKARREKNCEENPFLPPLATLAPHCVPWHRPPGQVWCSAGEHPEV